MPQQKEINKYKEEHKGESIAFWISKQDIIDLFNNNQSIDGIRMYLGENDNGKVHEFACATINGKDFFSNLLISRVYKNTLPCPDFCS